MSSFSNAQADGGNFPVEGNFENFSLKKTLNKVTDFTKKNAQTIGDVTQSAGAIISKLGAKDQPQTPSTPTVDTTNIPTQKSKSNLGLYLGIGGGVLALVVIIVIVARKKS